MREAGTQFPDRVRVGGDLPDVVIAGQRVPPGEKVAGMLYEEGAALRLWTQGHEVALWADGDGRVVPRGPRQLARGPTGAHRCAPPSERTQKLNDTPATKASGSISSSWLVPLTSPESFV
jgi:hypothetical protein